MKNAKRAIPVHQLQALESRYRATLRKIREELKRPMPDPFTIQTLKRRRVQLKDRIAELLRPFGTRTIIPN